MNNTNKVKAFTLIEILLVITLIGILASIVLVAINPNKQLSQARNLQRKSDIGAIYNALEMYAIRNRGTTYPGIDYTSKEICNTGTEQAGGAANCNEKIDLRGLVPKYIASVPNDPEGTSYQVSINPENNIISIIAPSAELSQVISINIPTTPGRTSCPTGYILVPGNSLYNTNNFCVAKYEMKAVAINAPTTGLTNPNTGFNTIANNTTATTSANDRAIASVASGYPIANINQTTAIDYCTNQNTVLGASLITNTEWMTIARNIEGQLSNWTTGTAASSAIGTGGLYRGHSEVDPDLVQNKALEAGPDNNGYIGTGQSEFSIEKRTLTLSNGEIIWDLSGNVWEWTNDTIMGVNKPNNSSGSFWQQWTSISNFGTLSYNLTRPSNNTWGSNQNMGQYNAGGLTGGPFAFRRGGGWAPESSASGIFALRLSLTPTDVSDGSGFRCVLR